MDVDTPWRSLSKEVQDIFLYGTKGERLYVSYTNRRGFKRSYMTNFEGIVPNLERRYRETDSDYMREKIEEYMTRGALPGLQGGPAAAAEPGGDDRRTQPPRARACCR